MGKCVLILHGFPQPINKSHVGYKYFQERDYDIVKPDLFDEKFDYANGGFVKSIKKELGYRKPDVIAAYSFGGLLAPYIAKEYPNAKLVLIATGPYLNIKPGLFRSVFYLARNKLILRLLNLYKYLPKNIQTFLYQKIMPYRGKKSDYQVYREDMNDNIKSLVKIPFSKQVDMLNFLNKTDNSDLLKKLTNKTLIFGGTSDILMPKELSEKLHKLIKDSILKVNKGEHFDVFTVSVYEDLDNFLN